MVIESKQKRAADGSPLWTCKHCGRPKRRKDMHTHGSAGNVCKACYDNTEVVDRKDLRISWVMANHAPRDLKREVDTRDRTVWKYVKAFLCYYRLPENKKNFNEAFHKKRIIPALTADCLTTAPFGARLPRRMAMPPSAW